MRNVRTLLGLTRRQLNWWADTGFVKPVLMPSSEGYEGCARGVRVYSPDQFLELAVLAELRRKGVSTQALRLLQPTLQRALHARPPYLLVGKLNVIPCESESEAVRLALLAHTPVFIIEPPLLLLGASPVDAKDKSPRKLRK
jgi:DNA-binding transcriptional MerR regulator